jgi:hypothetical protein
MAPRIDRTGMTVDERVRLMEIMFDDLFELAQETERRLDRIEQALWRGIGIMAGVVLVANIIAPFIFQALDKGP